MPGQVERVDGDQLCDVFLPTQSSEAKKKLRENRHFVKGQLTHYGIDYDERTVRGLGTNLLKRQLLEGKVGRDLRSPHQYLPDWVHPPGAGMLARPADKKRDDSVIKSLAISKSSEFK